MFIYGCRDNSTRYVYSSSYEDDDEEDIELKVQNDEEENDSYDEDCEYLSSDIVEDYPLSVWNEEEQVSEENGEVDSSDEDDPSSGESYFSQEYDAAVSMILCPMCMGNGQIQHYYTNEIMTCPACAGKGVVSDEVIRQLNEAEKIGRELAEKVMGIESGGSSEYSGLIDGTGMEGGGTRQLIESQINMLEQQIAMYEQGLINCESITLQSQYRNTITELQYQIRSLKLQLQNME